MSVLAGKAAIVTGAARGIGRAAAELLAEHGASILVSDVDAELAEETAAQIGDAVAVCGDLTDDGVPEAVVRNGRRELRPAGHRREQRRLHLGRHGA